MFSFPFILHLLFDFLLATNKQIRHRHNFDLIPSTRTRAVSALHRWNRSDRSRPVCVCVRVVRCISRADVRCQCLLLTLRIAAIVMEPISHLSGFTNSDRSLSIPCQVPMNRCMTQNCSMKTRPEYRMPFVVTQENVTRIVAFLQRVPNATSMEAVLRMFYPTTTMLVSIIK